MAVLDIWNQALGAVSSRGRLTSLTDRTPGAEVCAQWYDSVVKRVQEAAWWPCCRTFARLSRVSEADEFWTTASPEPGYAYGYALPINCLRPWHLTTYERFALSYSNELERMILSTNADEAILAYAVHQENVETWGRMKTDAVVYALAASIAGQLTGKRDIIQTNYELANRYLEEAQAIAANSVGGESRAAVPWFQARGYGDPLRVTFYYPFGELFPNA